MKSLPRANTLGSAVLAVAISAVPMVAGVDSASAATDGGTCSRVVGVTPHGMSHPIEFPVNSSGSERCSIPYGSRGATVENLQEALYLCFPLSETVNVDGVFGPQTRRLLIQAQKFLGVTADGVYGPQTGAAMVHFYKGGTCFTASQARS